MTDNYVRCQDCHRTDTRGRMHVRSRSFEQVFFCGSCWELHERLSMIVRAVREGVLETVGAR